MENISNNNSNTTDQLAYAWELENYLMKAPMIELLDNDNAREMFIKYMIEMYHYVKFSCPLMELTRSKLDKDKHAELIEYLDKHIKEEMDHEQWVLDDLEVLGLDRDVVIKSLPSREIISMIGSQFYFINEVNPVGFFGYIYLLESHPPTIDFINLISKITDIPLDALSALVHHAEIDPLHSLELNHIIDSYIVEQNDKYLVKYNMKLSIKNISDLLYSIISNYQH